jgi:hypothetical protein
MVMKLVVEVNHIKLSPLKSACHFPLHDVGPNLLCGAFSVRHYGFQTRE